MMVADRESVLELLNTAHSDASGAEVAEILRSVHPDGKPSEIAERLGIEVVHGEWSPVTAGEFENTERRITVNRKAAVDVETVIAHELGHYCLNLLGRTQDERFCDEFAEALTRRCSDLNHADGIL